jgi:hypothetical protein
MILHHFTRPELLASILRDGLKASCASTENDRTCAVPVVWLTERDTLVPTLKARKIMLSRGVLSGPGCSNLPTATVCLRVTIGSHDRKLVSWRKWVRKHDNGEDQDDPLIHEFKDWIYFGDIPPAKLTVLKHVPRTEPYWILDHHNDWLTTGAVAVFDPPELEDELLAGRAGPPDYVAAMAAMQEASRHERREAARGAA